jgi:cyclic-di-GMP-binding biofilm dispersal mediator protein
VACLREDDRVSSPTLVIGASGVLGSGIAEALYQIGYPLALAGRNEQRLFAVRQACGGAPAFGLDIRDAHQVRSVVSAASLQMGGLSGLVIASGIVGFGSVLDSTDAVAEELVLTNLLGPLAAIRAALPDLVENQGFICAITGLVAERPFANIAAYGASKSALASALTALRAELKRHRVDVINVSPPHTETGLAERAIEGEAPRMPAGLTAAQTVARIVTAIEAREPEVLSSAFQEH